MKPFCAPQKCIFNVTNSSEIICFKENLMKVARPKPVAVNKGVDENNDEIGNTIVNI